MSDVIDFKMILASSIHDMKNSLALLNQQIEELLGSPENVSPQWKRALTQMEYQASRVNNDLIKLLSLYKMAKDIYPLRIEEQNLCDFLEEQLLRHRPVAERLGIAIISEADPALQFHFDAVLMSGVLHDVIVNALKHARSRISMKAFIENNRGVICVEDDGPGYPESLLSKVFERAGESNFDSGSTGLGLYFAHEVAHRHASGTQVGSIALENKAASGGGRFRIFLPL